MVADMCATAVSLTNLTLTQAAGSGDRWCRTRVGYLPSCRSGVGVGGRRCATPARPSCPAGQTTLRPWRATLVQLRCTALIQADALLPPCRQALQQTEASHRRHRCYALPHGILLRAPAPTSRRPQVHVVESTPRLLACSTRSRTVHQNRLSSRAEHVGAGCGLACLFHKLQHLPRRQLAGMRARETRSR